MDKKTNKILNDTMINAAEIIKNACMARNGVCKGCIFNQLTSGEGDYDEFEDNNGAFSDEDDENGESETFCEEIFGGTAPRYWITEKIKCFKGLSEL